MSDNEVFFGLKHPFSMQIIGPTGVGKTELLFKILNERKRIIDKPIDKVYYVYGIYQIKFDEYAKIDPDVSFHSTIPVVEKKENSLFIFDDYQSNLSTEINKTFTDFITRECHHNSVSVIYTLQNAYIKNLRTASLNTTYMIFFNQIRDQTTIHQIARQMFPSKTNFLIEAYQYCTQKPRGYIFIDMHVLQNPKFRVRSNVFNDEDCVLFSPV